MRHDNLFIAHEPTKVIASGDHLYDFLGIKTRANYKKGWSKFCATRGSEIRTNYPAVNEHYFDYIVVLKAAVKARSCFRMAELGAGWAPWLVRGAFAARRHFPDIDLELCGVEADPTHFSWMSEHFTDNGIQGKEIRLLHGAVSTTQGKAKFPRVLNPDEDYGASTRQGDTADAFIEVPTYSLGTIVSGFTGPVDLLHFDIQGAEYDCIPSAIDVLNREVKSMMIGTHISSRHHDKLVELLTSNQWQVVFNFPRDTVSRTSYGDIHFGDGFLFLENSRYM